MNRDVEILKLGLIGAGRIGQLHAKNVVTRFDGVQLAAVVDVHEPSARELAERLNVERFGPSPDLVFEDPDIQAVLICSSTDTHAPLIEAAARAGKHIFCEKPIALDLDRIDAALEVVEIEGVKLQIGFNRRFDPSFAEVHKSVRDGQVGEPQLLRITSRDPAPPPVEYAASSGGIFLDMTIHDFDMARFLLGSEIEEVFAWGEVHVQPELRELGDVDTAIITLRFANGALGTIENSRKAVYGYDQRVEVFGSGGAVGADNETADRSWRYDGGGLREPRPLYFFTERYADAYVEELRSFLSAIRNDEEPEVGGKDGRIPVVVALAAKKSLREKRPVRISEIDRKLF